MRILYGINGTGNGHITKSSNIINKLKKLKIDVDILISGTNHQINIPFDIKYQLHGLSFKYDNNNGSVNYINTFKNLKFIQFLKDIHLNIKDYDMVITDFEPITAWAAKLQNKKSIGISHQYAFLSNKTPRPYEKSIVGEFVLSKMAPVDEAIGLHFKRYDKFIEYPIIRGDILKSSPLNHGHYTIYLPSYGLSTILEELNKHNHKFEIFNNEVKKSTKFKNCIVKPNAMGSFIESFTNCKGIITSAGFETPAEALYMNKEIMVIPIERQYEQMCNAEALKRLGVYSGKLSDVGIFLNSKSNKIDFKWEDPMDKIINKII